MLLFGFVHVEEWYVKSNRQEKAFIQAITGKEQTFIISILGAYVA
jgi:hypothetical protein